METRLRGLAVCLVVVLLSVGGGRVLAEKEGGDEVGFKEEFVVTLDHSNFTDTVAKHDFILVEFYAPWCGHCKKLAPEYEKAASELSKLDPPITLAKIDAADEANKDLAVKHGVQGFPTLKIIRNKGEIVQEYKGPREADGIVKYVKKQLGPASVELKCACDAPAHIDEKRIFIAGVFPEFAGEEYENFTKLAEKLRSDYDFGHTLDAKVLPRGDSSVVGPIIRLFKPFDELVADFKDFNLDAVQKFIEEEDSPSVVVFDQDSSNHAYLSKFFTTENTKVTLLLNMSSENAASLKSKFYDIAFLLKGGNLSFLIGDLEPSKPLLSYYDLEESHVPVIYVQAPCKKKYLKANVEPDQVVPWFKKFLDGKVEPHVKSQPIPEENNEPVKVVVLKNLEEMVLKSGKEVFLEFYAPWCVHCKNLAPILDEVAVSYENDPNVLIAKFDATANDVPSEIFEVKAYPTIYFIPTNGEMIEYEGNRTKEDIVEFIEMNRGDKNSSESEKKSSEPENKATSEHDEL